MTPITRDFYQHHPAEVAANLLGKLLVRQVDEQLVYGRIVETEAYCSTDPASHTFRGQTERNKAMFGEVGHAYIYFIHGMHYCLNVTAKADSPAGGVLIRALEPLQGIEVMQRLRRREALRELTSGPAKLAQALAIDKSLYGIDMTSPGPLFIAEPPHAEANAVTPTDIAATPRIGISRATEVLWRFILMGSDYLSR